MSTFTVSTSRETGTTTIKPKDSSAHSATVIVMHGLGDTAAGWTDVAGMWASKLPHVKFVLPTASEKPVSLNGGMAMPSWYDIKGLGPRSSETCDGIAGSVAIIKTLMSRELENGIPYKRIVLAGFSQGGAMALYTGLQDTRLGGIVSMSGYLPLPDKIKLSESAKSTPVLFCHGDADPVVQYQWGQLSAEKIKALGAESVEFKTYRGMEHSACDAEIKDVEAFLKQVIPPL